ncbi:MAG TPA: hypothetical protein PKN54_02320 [Candidatus Cloacimonas acidaminovorans]|nr:hypothetical protein [Candidatus Cloacimonas acidaminovorans]
MEAIALVYSMLLIVAMLVIVLALAVHTKLNQIDARLKQLELKNKPKRWASK